MSHFTAFSPQCSVQKDASGHTKDVGYHPFGGADRGINFTAHCSAKKRQSDCVHACTIAKATTCGKQQNNSWLDHGSRFLQGLQLGKGITQATVYTNPLSYYSIKVPEQ
jgi:hypothetical protein